MGAPPMPSTDCWRAPTWWSRSPSTPRTTAELLAGRRVLDTTYRRRRHRRYGAAVKHDDDKSVVVSLDQFIVGSVVVLLVVVPGFRVFGRRPQRGARGTPGDEIGASPHARPSAPSGMLRLQQASVTTLVIPLPP